MISSLVFTLSAAHRGFAMAPGVVRAALDRPLVGCTESEMGISARDQLCPLQPGVRPRVLIADDRADNKESLTIVLERAGLDVISSKSLVEAEKMIRTEPIDVVLTDVKMGAHDDGIRLLNLVLREGHCTPVIVYSGCATIRAAVTVTKLGAWDYLELPTDPDTIIGTVTAALNARAKSPNMGTSLNTARDAFHDIVAVSPAMRGVVEWTLRVGPTDLPALVLGETGTGKELIARALHATGVRRSGPFVAVNCGAIPEALFEAELFGFRKGAFTGAVADKPGLVEEADGGTLFLDELGELPLAMQVRLLRFLEQGETRRLGDTRARHVKVRVISATNRSLERDVAAGRFRPDLFFRVNVGHCQLPPLRDRPEDLEALVRLWLPQMAARLAPTVRSVSAAGLARLREHSWPGNARELRSVLGHAISIARGEEVTDLELSLAIGTGASSRLIETAADETDDDPRGRLVAAMQRHHWKVSRAAAALGVSRSTLWRHLKRYGIGEDESVA